MATEADIAERRTRLLGPMNGWDDEGLKREVREAFSRLGSALESLSGEQATWKAEAEWSAAQVGDHVVLGTGVMGNITALLAKGQAVTDADWDPPPQFRGDAADVGDVKKRLGDLPAFTDRLFEEGVKTDSLDETANNSLLGDMNWREWFYFLGVHANDHSGQIEKLRGIFVARSGPAVGAGVPGDGPVDDPGNSPAPPGGLDARLCGEFGGRAGRHAESGDEQECRQSSSRRRDAHAAGDAVGTPPGRARPRDRKSTRLNSSHVSLSRMPSSA